MFTVETWSKIAGWIGYRGGPYLSQKKADAALEKAASERGLARWREWAIVAQDAPMVCARTRHLRYAR